MRVFTNRLLIFSARRPSLAGQSVTPFLLTFRGVTFMSRNEIDPKRFDVYKIIHKYARSTLTNALVEAGKADFTQESVRKQFVATIAELVEFLEDHAKREDDYIHPLLKKCDDLKLSEVEGQHTELGQETELLLTHAKEIKDNDDGQRFYLQLAKFISSYFAHLNMEETELALVLHSNYSDAELAKMNGELMRNMPQEYNIRITRKMLPILNHHDRVYIYSAMKDSPMPRPAFQFFCKLASEALEREQAVKLFNDIGIEKKVIFDLFPSSGDNQNETAAAAAVYKAS